jgi:replication initiation protein RepC
VTGRQGTALSSIKRFLKPPLDFGVSERQIQKLERSLFEVGAIAWNDSGNHRRYGSRDPETGEIIYAYA